MFPEIVVHTFKLFRLYVFKGTAYRFQYKHSDEVYEYLTPHLIFSEYYHVYDYARDSYSK